MNRVLRASALVLLLCCIMASQWVMSWAHLRQAAGHYPYHFYYDALCWAFVNGFLLTGFIMALCGAIDDAMRIKPGGLSHSSVIAFIVAFGFLAGLEWNADVTGKIMAAFDGLLFMTVVFIRWPLSESASISDLRKDAGL